MKPAENKDSVSRKEQKISVEAVKKGRIIKRRPLKLPKKAKTTVGAKMPPEQKKVKRS